ncbi:hypothetical protein BC831DRAFT_466613 [Entophlyctis helioformis]|nr:hypothetical protein BC831DRAFT_466613 [Entophlyctis helioformis]
MDATQVIELFGFLSDPRLDVRNAASEYVAGLTSSPDAVQFFSHNNYKPVHDLMALIKDNVLVAHNAISALINLTSDLAIVNTMADDAFLSELVLQIILPKNVNADLCCMLLNNLSKHESVANKLLPPDSVQSMDADLAAPDSDQQTRAKKPTHRIDNLLEIFGCEFFLSRTSVDGTLRLSKLVVFTEHTDVIRRGGAISTIKNCCFGASMAKRGEAVLLGAELNLLVYILLPLSGPEDYDEDDMDGMPDELQFLEPSKRREQDPKIRLMLVEILVLLTSTRAAREYMRAIKVYPIVKKLHLQEHDMDVQEMIERLVNMLMRDEDPSGERNAIDATPVDNAAKRIKADEETDDGQIASLI